MVYSTLESTFAAAGPCWTIFFSKELIPDCTHPHPLPILSDWQLSLLCSGYLISSYTLVFWWLALTLFLNTLNPELPKNALFSLILWLFDTFSSHKPPPQLPHLSPAPSSSSTTFKKEQSQENRWVQCGKWKAVTHSRIYRLRNDKETQKNFLKNRSIYAPSGL